MYTLKVGDRTIGRFRGRNFSQNRTFPKKEENKSNEALIKITEFHQNYTMIFTLEIFFEHKC